MPEAAPTGMPEEKPLEGKWLGKPFLRYLQRHRSVRKTVAIGSVAIGVPVMVAIFWFAWGYLLPALWEWSFRGVGPTAGWEQILSAAGRWGIGGFGIIFVAFIPFSILPFLFGAWSDIAALYFEEDASVVSQAVKRGSDAQAGVEEELGKSDNSGLVLLLRYSRIQLEQYYAIGLTQTQRSFKYGVVAMWIGFVVIMMGILLTTLDVEKLDIPLRNDSSYLAFASGLVIEVISALFLWLYRRSIKQLTYFYDRQMYNHSVLMCFRIAATMTDSELVKKAIVERVLDRSWTQSDDPLPEGKSLLSMGSKMPGR